jgi:hypothetical protein
MKACFFIFGIILLNFLFCDASFGQKRKAPLKVKPLPIKTIDMSPINISSGEVVEDINYISYCTTKKDVCVSNEPWVTMRSCDYLPQIYADDKSPSLGQIIYLNDLLYKRPSTYFPGK